MRLFFALRFPQDAVQAICQVQQRLRLYAPSARYPGPENLHLTLAFLGEVASSRLGEAQAALNALRPVPMTLQLTQVGCFSQGGGGLWWLGPEPCPELFALQKELASQLECRGFSIEPKAFRPHITLARKVSFPGDKPQKKVLLPRAIQVPCRRVSLMRSQLTPRGAIYTELAGK